MIREAREAVNATPKRSWFCHERSELFETKPPPIVLPVARMRSHTKRVGAGSGTRARAHPRERTSARLGSHDFHRPLDRFDAVANQQFIMTNVEAKEIDSVDAGGFGLILTLKSLS